MNGHGWKYAFPEVYWHTSISLLRGYPGFSSAESGNFQAAQAIVQHCIKQQRIDRLRLTHPGAVVLPIMTDNKLPLALALAVGLELSTCAALLPGPLHKGACPTEPRFCQPEFAAVEPRRYILAEDIVVPGGRISALRKHVLRCGGTVEAVVALACSFGSELLLPRHGKIQQPEPAFKLQEIPRLPGSHDPSDSPLTHEQIKHLLCSSRECSMGKRAQGRPWHPADTLYPLAG